MPFLYVCFIWVGFYFKHKVRLIGISDEINASHPVLQTQVESETIYRIGKDGWIPIPGKIMIGNGISWVCIISLDLSRNDRGEYILEKMEIQPKILELLRCLPVSTRLGVW